MIRNVIKYGTAIIMLSMCMSCDLLRSAPFEVEHWSPGEAYHAQAENISVALSFSHDPDRASVEKYFSITADAEPLRGTFRWEDRTVHFVPFVPFENNREYVIKVFANAQSTRMLSMDWDFEGRFNTRFDSTRPHIVSCHPTQEGLMETDRGNCRIEFSLPISANSLRSNVSFSPSMSGIWNLEDEGLLAVFTPSEPWPQGGRFEMRVSASLAAANGMSVGKDSATVFTVGTNRTLPVLDTAWRLTDSGEKEALGEESSGWEKK